MSIPETISIVKDVVTIITLLIGAIATIYGISTWRKQITAKAEYDLAKRVLVAVYKVREIYNLIYAVIAMSNSPTDIDPHQDDLLNKLKDANASLDAELFEAEAMWGDQVIYMSRVLIFKNIGTDLTNYFFGHNEPEPLNLHLLGFDEFYDEVDEAVKGIEDMLRPKLKLTKK